MLDLWSWMSTLVTNYGYVGAFLISLFGNFTIFFPVPYAITIYAFGATLNPIILGVVCGIGSTIGEFSAYLVGMGSRKVLEKRFGNRLENAKRLVQKHGMAVVFIFALLPLPGDLLLIPLGMLRYDIRKVMIATFFGKVSMCLTIAFAGRFSFVFVKEIFESSGILGGVLSVVLLAIIVVGMLVIDWSKFVNLGDVKE